LEVARSREAQTVEDAISGVVDENVEVVFGSIVVVGDSVDLVVKVNRLLSRACALSADVNFLLFMLSLVTTSFNLLVVLSMLLLSPVLSLTFSVEVLILPLIKVL